MLFENFESWDLTKIEGFDDCINGITFTGSTLPVLCYDYKKMMEKAPEVFGGDKTSANIMLTEVIIEVEKMINPPTFFIGGLENRQDFHKLFMN